MCDVLVPLRDAAEVANANAQVILNDFRRKPRFSSNSRAPQEALAQRRTSARVFVQSVQTAMESIRQALGRFRDLAWNEGAIDLVQRAVGLQVPPVVVGDESFPTAHEAAYALAEVLDRLWQRCGGDWAAENAPDRLRAVSEDPEANVAIDTALLMWRRLRRIRQSLPGDLHGRIQQEYWAAAELLEESLAKSVRAAAPRPKTQDLPAEGKPPRRAAITCQEANEAACQLAEDDPSFVHGTARQWADRIREATGKTCSLSTVVDTRLWRATMQQSGRGRKGKRPKAVSLTSKLAATLGDQDEDLARLIAEHMADYEPSPVDGNSSESHRPVKHYRQL